MAEHTIEQLAARTRISVDALRSYEAKGLLSRPDGDGPAARYSESHVDRVRVIGDLLDRGYALDAIAELFSRQRRGDDLSDLLGVEAAATSPLSVERYPTLTLGQLAGMIGPVTDRVLRDAEQLGVLRPVDGDVVDDPDDRRLLIMNPKLLAVGAELVAAGIPLEAVLDEGLLVQADVDTVAQRFVQLIVDHLIDDGAVSPQAGDSSLTALVARLRPLADVVIEAHLTPAIERHTARALEGQLDRLLGDHEPGSHAP